VSRTRPAWLGPVVLGLVLAALLVRVAAAARPGIWADEIFSLAMATGHSLEHPAAQADPAHGDFQEPRDARPPAEFRRYAEHDREPAGPARVVRAVLLSDTSPPLYYLLLNPWTRAFSTGDAALRLFSVWWAAASLPLLWLLTREVGGDTRAAWSAVLLFSFSPPAVYYAAEGRMYAMVWVLALALALATLRLARDGIRPGLAALWVGAGSAGLLTHYFFGFVWLACLAWLWLARPRPRRGGLAGLVGVTLLAVLPWYVELPASLSRWRVSGEWLAGEMSWPHALGRITALAGGLFAGESYLSGWRWAGAAVGLLLALTLVRLARQGTLRELAAPRPLLLWAWVGAACAGPAIFDLLRDTTTSEIPRYAVSALPAALLLAALGLSRLPGAVHLAVLSAILLAWLPAGWAAATARTPRPSQPYVRLDSRLEAWAGPDDLILIHSNPSGVIGVARYLGRDLPLVSWVSRLGTRRVPDDLQLLLAGRRRVALVKIHHLGAPSPPEAWLRKHARLLGQESFRRSSAAVLYFGPRDGESFVPDAPGLALRPGAVR
jgi:4-amino-4-deoxy-L-arabinose transferase-like glycosyltransferase